MSSVTISEKDELSALSAILGELRGLRDALEALHENAEAADRAMPAWGNGAMALIYLMEDKIEDADRRLYAARHGKPCAGDPRHRADKAA